MSHDNEEITDLHRAIVQFMMRAKVVSSQTLTEEIFKNLYILEHHPDDPSSVKYDEKLDGAITVINNYLHELGFVIKRFKKSDEADLSYVFINTAGDEISKLMTAYSAKDIQAINRLIESIYKNPRSFVDDTDASNVITQATDGSYTKADSLKLLASLVRDKWLDDNNGTKKFVLSERLLAELGDTLKSQYSTESNGDF